MMKGYTISDAHRHIGECSLSHLKYSVADAVKDIETQGLKNALVFPLDLNLQSYNTMVATLSSKDDTIFSLLRFAPDETPLPELANMMRWNHRILGFKLHPSFGRIPVTSVKFAKAFEFLQRTNKIALIHCGRWKEVSHCSYVFEVAKKYPKLKIIAAHMGGNELRNMEFALKSCAEASNVYLDTSNCRMPFMIERAADQFDERLLFGSDIPWGAFMANVYAVLESRIAASVKQRILDLNFQKLVEETTSYVDAEETEKLQKGESV